MKLFLKGTRCSTSKCAVEQGHPAPGMHGQRRVRKVSNYGVQLREKQRLKQQYGMRENQFRLFFERARRRRGVTGEQLLQLLEARLDNVVFRLGFAPSLRAARQFVLHGHVMAGGRRVNVPSMIVKPGTKVQVHSGKYSRELAVRNLEITEPRPLAVWLARDVKNFEGEFLRVPSREEINPKVNEQLVVELYSR
jgi:small subunit ribosomal protein S4